MWVLEPKPGSSEKTTRVPDCCVIFPAPLKYIFEMMCSGCPRFEDSANSWWVLVSSEQLVLLLWFSQCTFKMVNVSLYVLL